VSTESLFRVLLYYKYVRIADPVGFTTEHRALCAELGLLGRILIAGEGINGTVSGSVAATEAYMAALHGDARFADMSFKIDPAEGHVFPKLAVRAREEIVALGLGEDDLFPGETTGKRLSPSEFHAMMARDDVIVLDGRNDYESALGHFKGAVCPPLGNFRDFPGWIRANLAKAKNRKILTYCTGGIRCEKLSGFLVEEGFRDVYQLEGGIVTYGKDETVRGEDFEGQCYVFDQRIAVEVNRTPTRKVISRCLHCGKPSERYVNCAWKPCNAQVFLCPECEETTGRYCGETCAGAGAENIS
jgi:UPF0176 protein